MPLCAFDVLERDINGHRAMLDGLARVGEVYSPSHWAVERVDADEIGLDT